MEIDLLNFWISLCPCPGCSKSVILWVSNKLVILTNKTQSDCFLFISLCFAPVQGWIWSACGIFFPFQYLSTHFLSSPPPSLISMLSYLFNLSLLHQPGRVWRLSVSGVTWVPPAVKNSEQLRRQAGSDQFSRWEKKHISGQTLEGLLKWIIY